VAIYHLSIKTISRNAGRSSVAAAAYRSAEKIYDYRTGLTFDFTQKGGVVHSEIMLPSHAPEQYQDRTVLWNSVEYVEKAKNSRAAREIEIALPAELPREEQINLAREYVQQFVDRGMCADFNIHDKRDGNPHAHIMLTTRPINPDGSWGAKSKKEYILDRHGQRIMLPSGEYKSRKISAVDWDNRENAELWREAWAKIINRELEKRGLELVDHRSYERQGLDLEPTRHLGPTAAQMEKEGHPSYLGDVNREIEGRNAKKERRRQSQREQEQTPAQRPSYEEWLEAHQRGKAPEREQSQGRERGR
jgi:ATP-dependent exoDNAse (exonuclease V) alpha subunit